MNATSSKVASFQVDHTKLAEGIYLRSRHGKISSWDLRFRRPSAHKPMTPGAVHVLEHVLATYLREIPELGDKVIALCPMGCLTGFYLVTETLRSSEIIKNALVRIELERFPLLSLAEVPGMNEVQCGNPDLNDLQGANDAFGEFVFSLLREEGEILGVDGR